MIGSVRGEVIEVGLNHALIEAAGVGYQVLATPATLATLRRGAEARLITAMIVREDSMTLYGFTDPDARELFGVLQTVTGVGPRLSRFVRVWRQRGRGGPLRGDGGIAAQPYRVAARRR